MKKTLSLLIALLLCLFVFAGCTNVIPNDGSQTTDDTLTTEHSHQWQDVSGEHACICTKCNEKQLKPEACKFVRENCDAPLVCTICYAVGDESPTEHNWQVVSQNRGCWYISESYVCSECNIEQFAGGELVLPNHNWSEKTADGKTTFSCIRCNESNTFISEIRVFSYAQALEYYKIGDPGVKHENFNNPAVESEITGAIDAIIRAEFELTIEYDTISVSYDEISNMWRVDFWTLDLDGNSQSVYINDNGLTCYIVYGE